MPRKAGSNALGRPKIILDEEQISRFIGKGFTVEYVADYFHCSVQTLYANYSEALRKGYVFRKGCLQAKQLHTAMAGNVTMQIWLGKQWLEQKDKVDHTTGGQPFNVVNEFFDGHQIPVATKASAASKPN